MEAVLKINEAKGTREFISRVLYNLKLFFTSRIALLCYLIFIPLGFIPFLISRKFSLEEKVVVVLLFSLAFYGGYKARIHYINKWEKALSLEQSGKYDEAYDIYYKMVTSNFAFINYREQKYLFQKVYSYYLGKNDKNRLKKLENIKKFYEKQRQIIEKAKKIYIDKILLFILFIYSLPYLNIVRKDKFKFSKNYFNFVLISFIGSFIFLYFYYKLFSFRHLYITSFYVWMTTFANLVFITPITEEILWRYLFYKFYINAERKNFHIFFSELSLLYCISYVAYINNPYRWFFVLIALVFMFSWILGIYMKRRKILKLKYRIALQNVMYFTAMHIPILWYNRSGKISFIFSLLMFTIFSSLLNYIYLKYKKIEYTITFHSIWNLCNFIFMSIFW